MRILYAVHALPAAEVGGTELYTQHLAETIAGKADHKSLEGSHDVAIATPAGHDTTVAGSRVYALPATANAMDPTGQESGLESGLVDQRIDWRFVEILDDFQPDVVHFQHFKRLSATLPRRCAARGIGCIATLHDFWTVCHREQLLRPSGAICSGPESVDKCAACYDDAIRSTRVRPERADTTPHGPTDDARTAVARRTAYLGAARRAVDLLIAPSRFLRDRFIAFGTPPDAIVQRRNGIPVGEFRETRFDPSGSLRIGYAGRITPAKGLHVLLSGFAQVKGDAELHIFGRFDPSETPYHARLAEQASDRVTFHGTYGNPSTPYENMDALVVPSLWYENSPLVIQEAFASRVPVITGDIGGMAELVRDGVNGRTYPHGDAEALGNVLHHLVDSPTVVSRLRAGIDPPKSLVDHARELVDLYAACREGRLREVDVTA